MESLRIKQGDTVYLRVFATDDASPAVPITGKADLLLYIQRGSDDYFLDFADNTFKSAKATVALTEVSAADAPGWYKRTLVTSAWTNALASDSYFLTVVQSPGTDVKNLPAVGEIIAGGYVSLLDAAISSRSATGAAMTLVAGAITAASFAVDAISANAVSAAAVGKIQSGVATAAAVAAVQALLPASLSGGRMRSAVESIGVDVITADAISAAAVAKIQAGLASVAGVWSAVFSGQAQNTFGWLVKRAHQLLNNKQTLTTAATNNLKTYDDDDTTPIATSTVLDVDGNPIALDAGEPASRTRGT